MTVLTAWVASEAEDQQEGVIDRTKLARVEPAEGAAEPLWVNDGRLLDEHAGLLSPSGPTT